MPNLPFDFLLSLNLSFRVFNLFEEYDHFRGERMSNIYL